MIGTFLSTTGATAARPVRSWACQMSTAPQAIAADLPHARRLLTYVRSQPAPPINDASRPLVDERNGLTCPGRAVWSSASRITTLTLSGKSRGSWSAARQTTVTSHPWLASVRASLRTRLSNVKSPYNAMATCGRWRPSCCATMSTYPRVTWDDLGSTRGSQRERGTEGLWPKSLSTRVACRIGRPRMARHLGRHAQAQTFGHRPSVKLGSQPRDGGS